MEAIEIYQKIIELAKDQSFPDFETANNFAMNKLRNDYYSTQKDAAYGNLCAQQSTLGYPTSYDHEAKAVALVRQAVAAELDARQQPAETKEAA